jgi:bifunctional pyridoxal-dependent enzyme with beta-cystathionase and maltose regulon repressor activities
MFLLYSPHNPVGKCFIKEELSYMAELSFEVSYN